ncbi:MAG: hypothetical protein MAG795_00644 [Candidatus Woesearchaeota archaeon]|nr:hypothetical protein [Candidatus Woesearchaeota archaeon]
MAREIFKNKEQIQRISTYIDGFDEHMQGGIPQGHIVLVTGVAGTMKSSLAFNILYHEATKGKVGVYLSLEQGYASLLNHFVNMNYDLDQINIMILSDISKINEAMSSIDQDKGGLLIIDLGTIRKQVGAMQISTGKDWLNLIKNIIRKSKEMGGCDHFCLDSLSALYVLADFQQARTKLFKLFEFLRDLQITSFLISEMPLTKDSYSEYGVEDYLADGIINLDLARRQRKVTREISIVKMRGTKCNHDVFSLEYSGKKFRAMYGGKIPLI